MSPASSLNRAEINLSALKTNYQIVKKLVAGQVMAVVRGDAYGHGLVECARALASVQARRLGVQDLREAKAVADAGVPAKIHILGGFHGPAQAALAVESGYVVTVHRRDQLAELSRTALKLGRRAEVMINVDTGLGALGIPAAEVPDAIGKTAGLDGLDVVGLCTRLASCGDAAAHRQLVRFSGLKEIADRTFPGRLAHSALSSGGILAHPEYRDDLSRVGLLLYGSPPFSESDPAVFGQPASRAAIRALRPVMRLRSQILAIRTFKAGETVGYGRTLELDRDTPVATLPAGFANGLSESRSGRGWALIGGRPAAQLGRISMSLSMYDATGMGVLPGHEAVLLGEQGAEIITANMAAEWQGVSAYEILRLAGGLNPRQFVER